MLKAGATPRHATVWAGMAAGLATLLAALPLAAQPTPSQPAPSQRAPSQRAPGPPAPSQPDLVLPEVVVDAARGSIARQQVPDRLGLRETRLDRDSIEAMPGSASQPLNQLLLQTPGVVQDSFGEIHIRGEHRNLQYRLNGVQLPEGLSGFGQVFDAQALRSVSLLSGALPAQYGFRTNAVIALETRNGTREPGGSLGVYGGARGLVQPQASWAGLLGGWDIFASGTLLRSQQGIENPTSSWRAIHDNTEQSRGLFTASRQLDDTTRFTLIGGTALSRFQIPNAAGQQPQFTAFGQSQFNSAALAARQWERNWYGVAAVQKSLGEVEVQVAPFIRYSSVHYLPSTQGELIFNGVASDVMRSNLAMGVQSDATWRATASHTLRAGLQATGERTGFRTATTVLPLDAQGNALDDPFAVRDRFGRTGWLLGGYVQDEWRLAENLTLNLGARWDQVVEYVSAGQVSPRANLVWRPSESTTLHAGYARSFTPAQFELAPTTTLQKFLGTTAAPASLQNDAVRPERAHRFNLGVLHQLTEALTLGADGYYKQVRDLLDYGQFGNALIFTPFNYRQGRIYGVEFSATWRTERWLAYANLAVSRSAATQIRSAQFTFDADELAYIQRKYIRTDHDQLYTGSAGASWRGWEGGRLSGTLLYGNGLRSGFANTQKLAPYATVNLGVQQDFAGPDNARWTARLDLINAFDSTYQLRSGTGIGVGAPRFGARRGVFAGLARAF